MSESLQDKLIIDLWTFVTFVYLIPSTILEAMRSSGTHIYGVNVLYVFLPVACAVLVYYMVCGRIKKYRYFVLYTKCTKINPRTKRIIDIAVVISLCVAMYLLYVYSAVYVIYYMFYMSITTMLSIRNGVEDIL